MESSATARLLADVLADELTSREDDPAPELIAVLDEDSGLTDVLLDRFRSSRLRVHADRLNAEQRMRDRLGTAANVDFVPESGPEFFHGAGVVALDLPTSRSALADIARLAGGAGCPLLLGVGRDRHMSTSMNRTLEVGYASVRASRGRQKARVLIATDPRIDPRTDSGPLEPHRRRIDEFDLELCAYGGAFAGTRIDAGTRLLLGTRDRWPAAARIIDLGCGTGVLSVVAARADSASRVLAIDESAAACRSAVATAAANQLSDRIEVQRSDGLTEQPDDCAELILCNPPFHVGTGKDSAPAMRMLTEAGRALAPGGELWIVQNSHLPYRRLLRAEVGRTELITQDRHYQVLRTQT